MNNTKLHSLFSQPQLRLFLLQVTETQLKLVPAKSFWFVIEVSGWLSGMTWAWNPNDVIRMTVSFPLGSALTVGFIFILHLAALWVPILPGVFQPRRQHHFLTPVSPGITLMVHSWSVRHCSCVPPLGPERSPTQSTIHRVESQRKASPEEIQDVLTQRKSKCVMGDQNSHLLPVGV